jgi:hypothetical protein
MRENQRHNDVKVEKEKYIIKGLETNKVFIYEMIIKRRCMTFGAL